MCALTNNCHYNPLIIFFNRSWWMRIKHREAGTISIYLGFFLSFPYSLFPLCTRMLKGGNRKLSSNVASPIHKRPSLRAAPLLDCANFLGEASCGPVWSTIQARAPFHISRFKIWADELRNCSSGVERPSAQESAMEWLGRSSLRHAPCAAACQILEGPVLDV